MRGKDVPEEINIDVSGRLAGVGDRVSVGDGARVEVGDGYDLSFYPGGGVAWSLELRRIAGGVEVSGTLAGEVQLECHRCLEGFPQLFDLELNEHALWLAGEEIEHGDDYADEYIVVDGVLDLLPILRDLICLALPSNRVCSPGCRGLCPVCGANANREPCGCPGRSIDARLKPLADLKKRLQGGDGK